MESWVDAEDVGTYAASTRGPRGVEYSRSVPPIRKWRGTRSRATVTKEEREARLGATEETYPFENARAVQLHRLRALEAALDAQTTELLDSIGLDRGWRCLEVGAGGGSIADWLCHRVAPEGTVLATDLDTSVLGELSRPNLEVRVHDVPKGRPTGGRV